MKIILKTTVSYWISFLVVAVAIGINYGIGAQPWRGEALLGVEWVWTAQFLVGPVVGAVAAYDGAKTISREPTSLLGTRKYKRKFISQWLVVSVASISIPYVVCTVIALLKSPFVPDYALFGTLMTPIFGIATVAIILLLGLFFGSVLGDKLGPLIALGSVLVIGVMALSGSTYALTLGGPSGSLIGMKRAPASLALQALVLAVSLGLLWLALVVLTVRNRWKTAFTTVAIVGLLLLLVPRSEVEAYAFADPSDENLSCTLSQPGETLDKTLEVCVVGEHVRLGSEVDLAFREIHHAASQAGIDNLPTKLLEVYPHTGIIDNSVATFSFATEQLDTGNEKTPIDAAWLVSQIVEPRSCPNLFSDIPPSEDYWEAIEVADQSLKGIVEASGQGVREQKRTFLTAWSEINKCKGAE